MVKVNVLLACVHNHRVFVSSSVTLPPYSFDTQQREHALSTRSGERDLHGKDVECVSSRSRHLEVGLQDVDCSRECFVATATEQSNPSIKQDGGDQGGVGNASQAFNTALKTPCRRPMEKS